MTHNILKQTVFLILLTTLSFAHADGLFEWTSSNFQVLHGSGFKLGANTRSTMTVEHTNGWRYGDNFLFIDVTQRDDVGVEVYGEWYPRLSLSRLSNKDLSIGVFKDFFLVGGINASTEPDGDAFKAYLLGVGTSFKLPGSGIFNLNFMAQKHDQVNTTGIQITPSWSIPFEIGRLKFIFDGFLDWVSNSSSGGKPFILMQPQLLLDVGSLVGNSGSIYLGIEYYYWRNKFGIDGIHEKALQGMLKITF
jgi:nucleoside-specific outer membrane channel protein Tsx